MTIAIPVVIKIVVVAIKIVVVAIEIAVMVSIVTVEVVAIAISRTCNLTRIHHEFRAAAMIDPNALLIESPA